MNTNTQQIKGRLDQAKGAVKEAAGKVVGNKTLEAKGLVQKNVGKLEVSAAKAKDSVSHAMDDRS